MNKTLSTLVICGSALTASCAHMDSMDGQASVTESVKVNAPAAEVWALVGEFNDLNRWHPAVKLSKQVSDRRYLTLQDGAEIVEEETSRDNSGMNYSYRILSGPLPVEAYNATISVTSMGDSQSKVTWQSTFDAKGMSRPEAEAVISGVYRGGLDQLQRMY
ncbi:SRPBCC family protein [Oceanobacter sp. 5_MG-2023]|uniref:SRPBCC family protein n=1 Tax=Oceanobacter sp. 5_MG-2023 TaxID=3062645 RepID=UPI0026E2BDD5|nr:SRPBCC family protein [Oceanobacter sp. 5_MG-2023]MDO6683243.1 SRPBCC family protein [Oceanobacter sp. 5_MG-2023]